MGAPIVSGSEQIVDVGTHGRRDLVAHSQTSMAKVIAAVKHAYRFRKAHAGFKVAGYAKLDRRKSWSVTFRRRQLNHIVEVRRDGSGTQVAFWGMVIDRGFKRRGPLRPLPPAVTPRVRP